MIYYPDSNFYQMVFIYPNDIIMMWDLNLKQMMKLKTSSIEQIYFYKYPILTFLNPHLMRDLMENKWNDICCN